MQWISITRPPQIGQIRLLEVDATMFDLLAARPPVWGPKSLFMAGYSDRPQLP